MFAFLWGTQKSHFMLFSVKRWLVVPDCVTKMFSCANISKEKEEVLVSFVLPDQEAIC